MPRIGLPLEFYTGRIKDLTGQIQTTKQRSNRIAALRLLVVIIAAVSVYIMWPDREFVAPIIIVALVIFLRLVAISARLKQRLNNLQTLLSINQQEVEIFNGYYTNRPDGSNFQQPHHPYSQDLDILGKASLFQYIHRTTSEQGHQLMADWLLQPAEQTTIQARQKAVQELSDKAEWRQQLQAYGTDNALDFSTQTSLSGWLAQPHRFKNNAAWQYARIILPAISLTLLVLYIIDIIQPGIFYTMVLVFFAASGYISKLVTPQYLQLSKHITQFETLSQSLQWLEGAKFEDKLLNNLQTALQMQSIAHQKSAAPGGTFSPDQAKNVTGLASKQVGALKRILDRMDYRLNPLVFIPLNILLFWDLQQVLQLERWKEQHQHKINDWFETIAQFEALSSLANLSFNHPSWVFPTIRADWFKLSCSEAGHPLIPPAKNVANNFSMQGHPQLAFITGSNMAGKSTFLRTIGTNLVLAMAGAPVCATYFETPVVRVMTSMRIADNLEESASTFYAELQKLKNILEAVKRISTPRLRSGSLDTPLGDRDPTTSPGTAQGLAGSNHISTPRVFLLLDEILRGTNSLDRHTGSEALLKQLIKEDAVGIIASHDLSLAELETQFPRIIHNYHFDVTIEGNELSFDYKLKEGVCQTLNATLLMKKIGIDL